MRRRVPLLVADGAGLAPRGPSSAGALRGWRRLATVATAVVAVHAWLLSSFPHGAPPPAVVATPAHPVPSPWRVRTLASAEPTLGAAVALKGAPPMPATAAVPRPVPRAVVSGAEPVPPTDPDAANRVPVEPAPAAAAPGAEASAARSPPVYRTLSPPAFAFIYDLQRGTERGQLELRWRRDAERYEATLVGTFGGAPLLALSSTGGFDAAGLAPQRHTDRRRGRSLQAVNFQRERGRITFSGPAVERALPAGVQDRLSWMLQLAAIAAADPALAAPGGQIVLAVAGVHGAADVWSFDFAGDEALTLADGSRSQTAHLVRLPTQPYDTRAEVWLDPTRHYLPLRARLSNPPSGRDALQLEFREAQAPP